MRALLLLLADSRLPAGGHVHSGGLEQAAAQGLLSDVHDLELFLLGRLRTSGRVAASLAAISAAAAGSPAEAAALRGCDEAADVRMPSAAARAASRAQGRGLVRAAGALLEVLPALPATPHHPVALGALVAAAGGDGDLAARLAAYQAVTGAATAAVRLLAFDPFAVQRVLADLAPEVDRVAAAGSRVPCAATSPLGDLLAEAHRTRELRLFAS